MYENMIHRPFTNDSGANHFQGIINNSINMSHSILQVDSSNLRELSTSKVHETNEKFLSFGSHESLVQPSAQELMPNDKLEMKTLKRKASDIDIDLDLSLKLNSRISEEHEVDSNLSLSLYSQSSFSYLNNKLKEGKDISKEQGKRANALDLTI